MNPMIRKELNLRMRERRGWILPSLYLVILGAVAVLAYYLVTQETRTKQGAEIGVAMFLTAAYTQLVLLLLLAPVFSAGALTIEKEQRTLAGLLTSLLSPFQIWCGKFVAALLFVLLLILIGMPVLSLAFAFGGVGLWEVGMATITTIVIVGAMSALGLYWSSVFRRSVHATAVSYASTIVLTVVTAIIFGIVVSTLKSKDSWMDIPFAVKAPMYLNPLFFLTMSFSSRQQLYPEWFRCLGVFLFLTAVAVVLAVRNLRRSGELV
jgi:ABC-2 type transport system permease protein